VQDITLRLILNLSHDVNVRNVLIKHGFLGKLVAFFENDLHSEIIISLLYQISIDEKSRSLAAFEQCIQPVSVSTLILARYSYADNTIKSSSYCSHCTLDQLGYCSCKLKTDLSK